MSNVQHRAQKKAQKKLDRKKAKDQIKQKQLVDAEVDKIRRAKKVAHTVTDEDYQKRQQVIASYENKTEASLNFLADRNGCGYYRMIWPFEMLAVNAQVQTINTFVHPSEFAILKNITSIRFQRQVEKGNMQMLDYYLHERHKYGFKYNIIYEMDDLLPEIDPSNVVAYKHFSGKTANHLDMLHKVDLMTVSTETLKEVYTKNYGIDGNKIMVIENTLPKFLYNFNRRAQAPDFTGRKPRVFWSGSGSHVGQNGDLDFMYEIVRRTTDKYTWVFQGVTPPALQDLADKKLIETHPWQNCYSLAAYQFNVCKADIYVTTLKPSRFNACKSDLKLLESSALGIPFIGTSFINDPNYDEYQSPYDGTPAQALLNGDVDEWITAIDDTLNDPEAYMSQVDMQYEYLNGRWMEDAPNLEKWYASMRTNRPQLQAPQQA